MNRCRMTFGLLVVVLVYALAVGQTGAEEQEAQKADADVKELSKANNQFGVELFQQLHNDSENTFISPTSIAMAMHMVNRASDGDTRSELDTAMHTKGIDLSKVNQMMMGTLDERDDVELNVANSLWADPSRVTLSEDYTREMNEYFRSEVRSENFSDPATLDIINGWINDKTEGMIPSMLDKIMPGTVSYLINAIYFKGTWTVEFKKEDTKEGKFHFVGGGEKKIKLMRRKGSMLYGEIDGTQVVRLPYGEDKEVAMWIALPPERELDALVKSLDGNSIDGWREKMKKRGGYVELPRFKLEYRKTLNAGLQQLGIKSAFDSSSADLTNMGTPKNEQRLFVDTVDHKAVIEVSEEGTEAAAVTIVRGGCTGPGPSSRFKRFSMICDRPFLVMIADDVTGSILFMGTVYEPESLD